MRAFVRVAVRPLAALSIAFLPDGRGVVRRVCSQAPVNQQPVEFVQHRHRNARLAQRHGRTHDTIQHPSRDHPYYAGLASTCATRPPLRLEVSYLDATPVQGMPTVMDFNFLPDMGRMISHLRWGARPGCLQDALRRVQQTGRRRT